MKLPPMADQPDRSHLSYLHRQKANTVGVHVVGEDANEQADQTEDAAATSNGSHASDNRQDHSPSQQQKDNKYLVSARRNESISEATTRKLAELDIRPPPATLSPPDSAAQSCLNPSATRPRNARSDTERSSASSSGPVPQVNAPPVSNGASPVHNVQIVEDDPINAKILQKTFVKAGFNVTWAENGQIGFEK